MPQWRLGKQQGEWLLNVNLAGEVLVIETASVDRRQCCFSIKCCSYSRFPFERSLFPSRLLLGALKTGGSVGPLMPCAKKFRAVCKKN